MSDLSILIPARNEMFLSRTIQDILEHAETDIEVIATLDGYWPDPPVADDPRVILIHHNESRGQRAATNDAAHAASGRWLMKADAHCAFDQGFDRKLLEVVQPDWTLAPTMRNLHAFDWVCPNGHRRYQGPSGPCATCGEPTVMDVVWIAKPSPQSTSYCFDATPHFQYFAEYKKRAEGRGPLSETMSLQGSCFLLSREKYFELNICDETWGSWGSQGIEVACKTWLSGGRVMVSHDTWYAHMFRTQGGDFSFPYPQSGRQIERARDTARSVFFNNAWPLQTRPLSWLVEKFWPVPGWEDEDLEALKAAGHDGYLHAPETAAIHASYTSPHRGILYYTDNRLAPEIMDACQHQLAMCSDAWHAPIVSVSLQPLSFGSVNLTVQEEPGYLTMFTQILTGLKALEVMGVEVVYFAEHDVLYHPSHFEFIPEETGIVYYNTNFWKVRYPDGHALHYDAKQTSGLCANIETLIAHYERRVSHTAEKLYELGDTHAYRRFIRAQGFEPGTHGRAERVDDLHSASWKSTYPNLDIRHDKNLTPSRWRQDQFRDRRNCQGWQEAECVEGWYEAGQFATWIGGFR